MLIQLQGPLLGTILATLISAAPAPAPTASGAAASPKVRAERALPANCKFDLAKAPPAAPTGALDTRLEWATRQFLGVRYQVDPLGEGVGAVPDPEPRLRCELMDCLTFVETSLALARARAVDEVAPLLDALRYEGEVSYAGRNHFFAEQWVPANERKGFIRELTQALGKERIAHSPREVTLAKWKGRTQARELVLPDARAPLGSFSGDYLPLDLFEELLPSIPSGTLFAVVREPREQSPFDVTHVGFIFQRPLPGGGSEPFFRHAARDPYARVVDESPARFLRRCRMPRAWKVIGVRLYELLPPPSPLAATASEGASSP